MDLTLVAKPLPESAGIDTDGLVHKHLERKLSKIEERLGGKTLTCRAVLEELPVGYRATVSIQGKQETVGRAKEAELLKAVDGALDKLARQVTSRLDKQSGKERGRRTSSQMKRGESSF